MNEVRSWNDTPAGLLANRGWRIDDAAANREAEWRQARAEFEARVMADPEWSAARQRQRDIAEYIAGRGQVIDVPCTIPEALRPLHAARGLSGSAQKLTGPAGESSYTGSAEAVEMLREGERIAAERQAMIGRVMLPPGSPR